MPNRKDIDTIRKELYKNHSGRVRMDESTYENTHSVSRFVDVDYGEWWATAGPVIRGTTQHKLRAIETRKHKGKMTCEDVFDKVFSLTNGKVRLLKDTYKNTYTKATFIHEDYGVWDVIPKQIWLYNLKGPQRAVAFERARNIAKNNSKYTHILFHWKTKERLICQGSYEKRVVDYLNVNQVDFRWQPQVFKMPNGKTYRPDCYLLNKDLWIEIKGYFRKDAKEKWDWFQKEYPNSELWDREKLIEMKIL